MRYLIDANLPYYFSLWKTNEYQHIFDINDAWDDDQIWKYALENNLTIITKDSDFSNRILFRNPPPKVIHIRFGNLRMKVFFERITQCWDEAVRLSNSNKLVNIYKDRIEAIN